MKTSFKTKVNALSSSIFGFLYVETGIDLSLLKIVWANTAVVIRTLTYHSFYVFRFIKIIKENTISNKSLIHN